MEDWLERMLSQFARQVKYGRRDSSYVWVLPRRNWDKALHAIQLTIDPNVVIVKSSLPPESTDLFANLKLLVESVQRGDSVLVLIDDANSSQFFNLLFQLVGSMGNIRHNSTVFAFGIDTFKIHENFCFSVLIDPEDFKKVLEPNLKNGKLGPVFHLLD